VEQVLVVAVVVLHLLALLETRLGQLVALAVMDIHSL
jgi:hypothetical protein